MFKINTKNLFIFIVISMMAISCDNDDNIANPDLDGLQVSGFDESIAIVEVHSHEEEEGEEEEEHEDADGFILEGENGQEAYKQCEGNATGPISVSKDTTLELLVNLLFSTLLLFK